MVSQRLVSRLPLKAVATVLIVLIAIAGLVRIPRHDRATDFPSYFFAAKAVGVGVSPYDFHAVETLAKQGGMGFYFPYIYPPILAHGLHLLPLGGELPAQIVWGGLMVGCYVGMLVLLARLLGVRGGKPVPEPVEGAWLFIVATVAWILVRSAREDFFNGQINCLVALLSVAAIYLSESRRWAWAGLALAGAILVKVSPLVLALYLLLRGQTKPLFWTAAFLVGLMLLDIVAFGTKDWIDFIRIARESGFSHPPEGVRSFSLAVSSLPGVFTNFLGDGSPWVARGSLLVFGLMTLAVLWTGRRGIFDESRGPAYGACALLAFLSAPLIWNHHYVLFVPVLALLAQYVIEAYPRSWKGILVAGAILCFFGLPWDRRIVDFVTSHGLAHDQFAVVLNFAAVFAVFALCLALWSRSPGVSRLSMSETGRSGQAAQE